MIKPFLNTHSGAIALIAIASVAALSLTRASAAPNASTDASTNTLPFQGRLTSAAGAPITANLPMAFRLYATPTGGSPLWQETRGPAITQTVAVVDGVFTVMLGDVTPLPAGLTANPNLWLGVTIGADAEMTPRTQLGSAAFALQAATVPDGAIGTAKVVPGAIDNSRITINAPLNLNGNTITNARSIAGPGVNFLELESGPRAWNNGSWVRGAWLWLADTVMPAASAQFAGSARIAIAQDSTVGNSPFFDVVRIQDNQVSQRLFIVDAAGNTSSVGLKSAVINTTQGSTKVYAVEAADVRLTDEGVIGMNAGSATITLDPLFAQMIEQDPDSYVITVTPYGDASLFIADIAATRFTVRSRNGESVRFAWRFSAIRKGYRDERLRVVGEDDRRSTTDGR
jgi:hypothetical protein